MGDAALSVGRLAGDGDRLLPGLLPWTLHRDDGWLDPDGSAVGRLLGGELNAFGVEPAGLVVVRARRQIQCPLGARQIRRGDARRLLQLSEVGMFQRAFMDAVLVAPAVQFRLLAADGHGLRLWV